MHRFAAWVRGPAPGLFLAIGLALLAAPIGALSIPAGAAGDAPPRPLTESGNTFAVDLYQQLSADRVLLAENRGNLFFSPFSIHTALAMVWFGAAGDTAGEMTAALRLQPGIAQGDFTHQLAAVGGAGGGGAAGSGSPAAGCELSTANGLWGQHDCEFSADYLRILRTAFFAGFDAVDFKRDAAEIAAKINRWVAGQTHDKIKDLIDAGALDRNTRLVLVNAIYFKGRWLDRFEPTDTRDGAFHLTKDQQVQVPTMHRTFASVPYRQGEGVKVLELPYQGGDVAMLLVLPDAVDGLAAVEAGLSAGKLADWLSLSARSEVMVAMPRFTLRHRLQLVPVMQRLGMKNLFSASVADLSKMLTPAGWAGLLARGARLAVSAIIHLAFVAVDEEGTEAAAATAIAVAGCESAGPPPRQFIIDRPFLFVIHHRPTGRVLFMGRVADPRG